MAALHPQVRTFKRLNSQTLGPSSSSLTLSFPSFLPPYLPPSFPPSLSLPPSFPFMLLSTCTRMNANLKFKHTHLCMHTNVHTHTNTQPGILIHTHLRTQITSTRKLATYKYAVWVKHSLAQACFPCNHTHTCSYACENHTTCLPPFLLQRAVAAAPGIRPGETAEWSHLSGCGSCAAHPA